MSSVGLGKRYAGRAHGKPQAHLVLADPVTGGVGRQAGVPDIGGVLRVGRVAAGGRIDQVAVLRVVPAEITSSASTQQDIWCKAK